MRKTSPRNSNVLSSGKTLLTALCLGLTITFSACGGTPPPTDPTAPAQSTAPAFKLETTKLVQYSQIGNRNANGGQFAVITLALKNDSNEDITFQPADFFIQPITDKPEERYQQSAEADMYLDVMKSIGNAEAGNLLRTPIMVHPRFTLEKILIFNLPPDSTPDKYELIHKPTTTTTPLVGPNTEVQDSPAR